MIMLVMIRVDVQSLDLIVGQNLNNRKHNRRTWIGPHDDPVYRSDIFCSYFIVEM